MDGSRDGTPAQGSTPRCVVTIVRRDHPRRSWYAWCSAHGMVGKREGRPGLAAHLGRRHQYANGGGWSVRWWPGNGHSPASLAEHFPHRRAPVGAP